MTASEKPPHPDRIRKFSSLLLCRFLLTALVLLLFGSSAAFEFNYQDDSVNIGGNPHLNPPSLAGVHHLWTHGYVGLFIPVTYTFWAMLAQFSILLTGGDQPLSPILFHVANILVHLASTLLVFSILRRLLAGPRSLFAAVAGAAFFAIHPLQVEPVAWVTGMKDLLSGALSLGAVLVYLRSLPGADRPSTTPRVCLRQYLYATVLFAAAVLAKPSAVAVPAVLFLLELGFIENASWKRALRLLAPWFAIAVIMVFLSKHLQPQNSGFIATPLWFRPIVMLDAAGFYLRQILWPAVLSSDYGRTPQSLFSLGLWKNLGWIALALVAVAAAFPAHRKRNLCHVALFGAAIFPNSGIVPFAFQVQSTVADRYAYVALFVAALALGRFLLLARANRIAVALALVALAAFSLRTAAHLPHFENEETVYRHSLEGNPHSAHIRFNLANTLRNEERFDEAAAQYEILLRSHPDFAAPYINLAAIHSARNEHERAENLYRQALVLKGQFEPFARHGLAMSLAARGNFAEADDHFRQGVLLDPANQGRYLDWAHVLESQDRDADAAAVYTEAARNTAAPVVFLRMAAQAWHAAGDLPRCQAELNRILGENTEDIFALNLLAWLRATAADPAVRNAAEAVRLAESVCALTQFRDPAAMDTLAAAYAASGRFDDALATLAQMVDATRNLSAEDFARAERVFDRRADHYRRREALTGPAAKPFLEVAAQ